MSSKCHKLHFRTFVEFKDWGKGGDQTNLSIVRILRGFGASTPSPLIDFSLTEQENICTKHRKSDDGRQKKSDDGRQKKGVGGADKVSG